jgi:GNAT superfamily N-acetyltransferase
MNNESIQIRKILPDDIQRAMKLVYAEGWNQTERDWQLLIENPQNVCFVAEIDDRLVGTAAAINYFNTVAWIGMVLVNKEYRGRGISKILLSSVFEKLSSCKSIKLDATPAGQAVYEKLGFVNEYQIFRMLNTSFDCLQSKDLKIIPKKVQETDIPLIIVLDKHSFGSDRTQLISSLIKEFPEKSWVLKQNDKILGFALGRKGNRYHQIGPVSAQSSDYAKLLITYALKDLSTQSVVIDVLDDKRELANWLISVGFVKQRSFMRMFLKTNPFPGQISFQYLISGPEFG